MWLSSMSGHCNLLTPFYAHAAGQSTEKVQAFMLHPLLTKRIADRTLDMTPVLILEGLQDLAACLHAALKLADLTLGDPPRVIPWTAACVLCCRTSEPAVPPRKQPCL